MPATSDFLFTIFETQRLLRLYADKRARQFGITRAQWAVLARVARAEGLKQAEIAESMEIQPISLTRLIDKLCDMGLIERRNDDSDRRVKRLYLKPEAKPLIGDLARLRAEITLNALASLSQAEVEHLVSHIETVKENIRVALLDGD